MSSVDYVTNKILGKLSCVGSDAQMHGHGLKIVASAWFLLRSFAPKEGSCHISSPGRGPGFEDWCFLPKTAAAPWTSLPGRSLHWVKTDNCSPGQHPRYSLLSTPGKLTVICCAALETSTQGRWACLLWTLGTAKGFKRQVVSESSFLYTK